MALRIDSKKEIVDQISDVAGRAVSLVAADYAGLSVSEVDILRNEARKHDVYVKVVRNTLARRALGQTANFGCVEPELKGPIILLFAMNEPGAAAKVVRDFLKKNDTMEVRAVVVDGELFAASDLKAIASLPTKLEALSSLAGTMLAPVTGVALTVNAVTTGLVRTLQAVVDKKQAV